MYLLFFFHPLFETKSTNITAKQVLLEPTLGISSLQKFFYCGWVYNQVFLNVAIFPNIAIFFLQFIIFNKKCKHLVSPS